MTVFTNVPCSLECMLIHSKQNSYCLTFSNNSLTMRIFQNLNSCFMSGQLTDVIHGNSCLWFVGNIYKMSLGYERYECVYFNHT